VRYSGTSFIYQFSGIFASGLTPILATQFLRLGDNAPWYLCLYVLIVSLISAVSVYLMHDTHQRDITVDTATEPAAQSAAAGKPTPQGVSAG
jgi:hypothetical protein